MSDIPQGPGWWQASDGRWYPPADAPAPPGAPATGPPPVTAAPTSGKATATLVLALVSFVLCPVLPAIAALVIGAQAAREIRESAGRLTGEGLVKAGRIIAIANIVLSLVAFAAVVAIAVPTFKTAETKAQDRTAQSRLRAALTTEYTYLADGSGRWTDDPNELAAIDPSTRFERGSVPVTTELVYVVAEDEILGMSTKSHTGTCFYVMANLARQAVTYAEDGDCGPVEDQDFAESW